MKFKYSESVEKQIIAEKKKAKESGKRIASVTLSADELAELRESYDIKSGDQFRGITVVAEGA